MSSVQICNYSSPVAHCRNSSKAQREELVLIGAARFGLQKGFFELEVLCLRLHALTIPFGVVILYQSSVFSETTKLSNRNGSKTQGLGLEPCKC